MIKKIITIFIFVKIALTLKILFIGIVWAQNIWDIQARFCELNPNNNEMNVVTQADTETEVCVIFQNKSDIDTILNIDFVDGSITPDGTRSCFSPEKPKTNFGQYLLNRENKLELPANSELKQEYKIKFPVWFSWVSHGCLAYNIQNTNIWWWNINMVFRKVHSIDILVWWIQVKSKIKPTKISISWDQASNRLIFDIENNWNVDQLVQISGTISNLFGYKQEFNIPEFVITAQEKQSISSNILNLPDYKWLFSIKLDVFHQPKFNFHINNSNLNNEYTNPWIISISKTLMIWNRFYVVSLSVIMLLITIIIFKKRKNNH